ncbi:hypothetical protein PISMIDRAFT_16537 [Pisolithus microcarpus 441]|uniref:Uncharacterized protein n=1 Tax=Pisolithus microcarpus 441 TaxID=765257 RepID=A0A0C9YFQ1_9AGAM|nr:hypothetical protein PISMIDRAFT_16537 [Pisolithus microcarpus 441]
MSIPRPSDPHWVTGNMEQASPFLETGNFVGQGAGGFKPEEWSTGWGSDGMSTGDYDDILMAVGYRYTYKPGYTRGGLKDFFTMSLASEIQDPPNIFKDSEFSPCVALAVGLRRVLFNPGVHRLQDPRSRVYNFTPWLEAIPKVNDFAFERVTGFVRSSQDNDLRILAKQHRPFVGSTFSLTGHAHFLASGDRAIDTSPLSRIFAHESTTFAPGRCMPVSVILDYNDCVWSIDSDKANVIAKKKSGRITASEGS